MINCELKLIWKKVSLSSSQQSANSILNLIFYGTITKFYFRFFLISIGLFLIVSVDECSLTTESSWIIWLTTANHGLRFHKLLKILMGWSRKPWSSIIFHCFWSRVKIFCGYIAFATTTTPYMSKCVGNMSLELKMSRPPIEIMCWLVELHIIRSFRVILARSFIFCRDGCWQWFSKWSLDTPFVNLNRAWDNIFRFIWEPWRSHASVPSTIRGVRTRNSRILLIGLNL